MASPIVQAIKQICEEKGVSYESVMTTIEAALAAAYRKDFGKKNQNIRVEFDPETGAMRAFDIKTVVRDFTEEELEEMKGDEARQGSAPSQLQGSSFAPPAGGAADARSAAQEPSPAMPLEVGKKEDGAPDSPAASGLAGIEKEEEKEKFNPKTMMMISEARAIKPDAEIGEELRIELEIPHAFGRMAAQTAKQVITQKLREAERQTIFEEWSGKEGRIVTGIVGRREGRLQFVDFGRTSAILPPPEQIEQESYRSGERLKFYVKSVTMGSKGPEIVVSRADSRMVSELFRLEIPEVQNGVVEVKGVAREAGARTKIAVISNDENIDPIGSCIGQRGGRIQTIIAELGGEKIDVIQWSEDNEKYIVAALSPAKVKKVELNEDIREAHVTVDEAELSLAIGRAGQNVRLASRLTGRRISILGAKGEEVASSESSEEPAPKIEDSPGAPDAPAEAEKEAEGVKP